MNTDFMIGTGKLIPSTDPAWVPQIGELVVGQHPDVYSGGIVLFYVQGIEGSWFFGSMSSVRFAKESLRPATPEEIKKMGEKHFPDSYPYNNYRSK